LDIYEAIRSRNSVRRFTDRKIEGQVEKDLREIINLCNEESGLNFQLCLNEPKAFRSKFFHYGSFENCRNYIALIGPKGRDEDCGYYGQKIVIKAQQLGLNTCWVGLTYNKFTIPYKLRKGESIRLVIAIGYGQNQGKPHKSKEMDKLCRLEGEMPAWFKNGMEMVLLAPSAINQQKFLFTLRDNTVIAEALPAVYSKVDLGIAKYHFEIGAGIENFKWG